MNYMNKVYKTLNILCVEDDVNVLDAYKQLFSFMFGKVYFATDGEKGLESFKKHKVDVVITDFNMPNKNGLDMAEEIRAIDHSVPIILVTALEDLTMLKKALDINITSFLKKPFTSLSLFNVFEVAAKTVISDRLLLKKQNEDLEYSKYQEELTFSKEKMILKNDFEDGVLCEKFYSHIVYESLDILSGDSYLLRKTKDGFLLFLVDGMGKGISASVTAMLCSGFVNYYLSSSKEFILENLLVELQRFISPNLLEDEAISMSVLHFETLSSKLQYSIYSMPSLLYTIDDKLIKIRSNNPPLSKYTKKLNIDEVDFCNFQKMLVCSDGLTDCSLSIDKEKTYKQQLESDFMASHNGEDFETIMFKNIFKQEDDITFIFINK